MHDAQTGEALVRVLVEDGFLLIVECLELPQGVGEFAGPFM